MLNGLEVIAEQLYHIFVIYPSLQAQFTNLSQNPQLQLQLLKYVFVLSATSFVSAGYGVTLLLNPSKTLKHLHLLVGLAILVATYTASHYIHLPMPTI